MFYPPPPGRAVTLVLIPQTTLALFMTFPTPEGSTTSPVHWHFTEPADFFSPSPQLTVLSEADFIAIALQEAEHMTGEKSLLPAPAAVLHYSPISRQTCTAWSDPEQSVKEAQRILFQRYWIQRSLIDCKASSGPSSDLMERTIKGVNSATGNTCTIVSL